mgnify:FL=1
MNLIERTSDDEFLGNIERENLGSKAFTTKKAQSVLATDRNYLLEHQKHSAKSLTIPNPFDTEKAETLFAMMQEAYQDSRQLTPYEILVQREDETSQAELEAFNAAE